MQLIYAAICLISMRKSASARSWFPRQRKLEVAVGMSISPPQCQFGGAPCKTTTPTTVNLLQPKYDVADDRQRKEERHHAAAVQANKSRRDLEPLAPGDKVFMQPIDKSREWERGVVQMAAVEAMRWPAKERFSDGTDSSYDKTEPSQPTMSRSNQMPRERQSRLRPESQSLRFQASGDAEIKTVPRHFARANQVDRCMTLLHCAQRLTPWLVDTRGWWPQKLSAFLCLSATWHFNTSGRYMVECTRSIFSQSLQPAAAYLAISLLRPSGEKKQTFSVVSLQLTVQLPCLKVFSSFILLSRACQKRSFDDVRTVASGAEVGVKTRQADRSPQSLRSTKIRAWLPWRTARPETFCGVLATLVVWTARVSRSMELSIGCVRRPNGCVRRPNEKGRFFPFKPSSISF